MATDTATANTGEREGSEGAVIVIADISRVGVSSEHLDMTPRERTIMPSIP